MKIDIALLTLMLNSLTPECNSLEERNGSDNCQLKLSNVQLTESNQCYSMSVILMGEERCQLETALSGGHYVVIRLLLVWLLH